MEAVARLNDYPTSPRKMRLVADLIRGKGIANALSILKFSTKHNARPLEKLVLSAVANWQQHNPEADVDQSDLYIKTIFVDGGKMIKRLRPAPQGRANRIRKRSNHVTLIVGSRAEA